MHIQYPSSFLKLLLIGFAFAILPLMLSFININIAFNQLSKNSQTTIDEAVKATRASLTMQQQLHLMERSVRQYFVLNDEALFSNYVNSHDKFVAATATLLTLASTKSYQQKLNTLLSQTNKTDLAIMDAKSRETKTYTFLNNFNLISAQVDEIIQENNLAIDKASQVLDKSSTRQQSRFFLQSLILLPFSIFVTAIMAYLLGRPIKRMDSAIKDLGKGNYQQIIAIDGPGDLRLLGQRLNWLRDTLLNLKQQKQQFLQHISHELKTPLTAIREAAELLSDGVGGPVNKQQSEIISIMRENSIRLQKMIEHLLMFTKIESEKQVLTLTEIDEKTFFDQLIQAHALSIRNKSLDIALNLNIKNIIADNNKLLIILDNILSNAIKFSPNHGKIEISSKLDKHWQVIAIEDHGVGLSKEDKARLFDPFYQSQTLHQGLVSSSGLGLSIAKNLIEEHQGIIELAETQTGAHFIVRLPKNVSLRSELT
jgi:two-component system, NtrC family, sensor histidine kinase GlrK